MRHYIEVEHEKCSGCKSCEMVCSLVHFDECNPAKSAIRVVRKEVNGTAYCIPLVCQQCEEALCIDSCPTGAIIRDTAKGIVSIDKESCILCGDCVNACPVSSLFMLPGSVEVIKCDLCGGQPQCVDICHVNCILDKTDDDMSGTKGTQRMVSILDREGFNEYIYWKEA